MQKPLHVTTIEFVRYFPNCDNVAVMNCPRDIIATDGNRAIWSENKDSTNVMVASPTIVESVLMSSSLEHSNIRLIPSKVHQTYDSSGWWGVQRPDILLPSQHLASLSWRCPFIADRWGCSYRMWTNRRDYFGWPPKSSEGPSLIPGFVSMSGSNPNHHRTWVIVDDIVKVYYCSPKGWWWR